METPSTDSPDSPADETLHLPPGVGPAPGAEVQERPDGDPPGPEPERTVPCTSTDSRRMHVGHRRIDAPTFLTTTLFLWECYRHLMQSDVECLNYITGIWLGSYATLDRLITFRLAVQRTAYVRGDIISSTAALMMLSDRGLPLTAWGHCHPGDGVQCTSPSPTDFKHQRRLEQGGYTCIGLIMTRDGTLRFFSDQLPFSVQVFGSDVSRIGPTTYRLDLDFSGEPNEEREDATEVIP